MPRTQRIIFIGLIILFLCAGLVGHDPWKQDETYTFGIIWHFYTTHTWLVPTNAGQPFMEKPPLYYWSAVLMCRLLGGVLPLHDAARLTNLFYMALTLVFMWKSCQVLFAGRPNREQLGWIALALLLGSLGLVRHAHDMFTDVALLSGTTIAFYGMAVLLAAPTRWKRAACWLGLGLGIAFMSKGVFVPGLFVLSGALLWLCLPALRTRTTLRAVLLALLVASPFVLIWPAMLYVYWPKLFITWFWDNNIGRFLGFSVPTLGAENIPFYFVWITPVFAFPAFPLALAEACVGRRQWRRPEYILPMALAIIGGAALFTSASARALYLLPLLPAFAVLGAQALARIPPRWLTPWDYAVILLFSLATIVAWLVWWGLQHPVASGFIHFLLHIAARWLPLDFTPAGSQIIACATSAAFALFWLLACLGREEAHLHAARLWLTGIAMLWGTTMTLWLPWIDVTRSYRPLLLQMQQAAEHATPGSCVAAYQLGESIAPMLEYTSNKPLVADGFDAPTCPMLVTVARHNDPQQTAHTRGWQLIWKGSRLLDEKNEELRLYKHVIP